MIHIGDDRILSGKNAVKDILTKVLTENLLKGNFIQKMNCNTNTINESISDLATLEISDVINKSEYNFGSYFSLCEWMALNFYYYRDSSKANNEEFVFIQKYIEEEHDRKKIYSSFKKFIERNPKVSTLFFNHPIKFPTDDRDVYTKDFTFNCFFKDTFELFLLDTIEIKKLVKYPSHRSKFRKVIIDTWNLNVCPYCNIVPLISYDGSKKSTAELDHLLSQSHFPLFGLSYGNFIVSCSNCNQKFKNDNYSNTLNLRKEGFDPDVVFTHTDISNDSFYKPNVNEVKIKIKNNCSNSVKYEQVENSITNFKLRDCYEKNDIAKEKVCSIYRYMKNMYTAVYLSNTQKVAKLQKSNINELLKDFIVENNSLIDGYYPSRSDIINHSYGKLTRDTLDDILKGYKLD